MSEAKNEVQKTQSGDLERAVMLHFLALMEGLEIPNPEWYLQQHPEVLMRIGRAIAHQAKQAASET
jgi:hypothetical protein